MFDMFRISLTFFGSNGIIESKFCDPDRFLKLMSHFQSLAGEFHQMNDSTDCEYHKLASEDSVIALLPWTSKTWKNFTPSYKSHTQLMVNESK